MNLQQEEKKELIIREGLKILYAKGYNGTGVKEITDAAAIPKGSFYNYFSSKEDFAVAAMRYFTELELTVMKDILADAATPPLKRIENLYQLKIKQFIARGQFSFGCFLGNITLEMADASATIAQEAAAAFEREYQPIRACLEEARQQGDLAADRDLEQITELLRTAWLGTLVMMKANKNQEPLLRFQETLRQVILR
ncbi:TetR/AcrR family transcriptional regulator [Desulfogranum mediterraneum]|uniref:TetR/AcrR family transcriptional regulator n=1 Tax=Desulfogranum mediterraneum TaxID=160661 RepID=UPI00041DB2F3|nr:TetR/AcrR family transcriptional regulator [Desulfogranum mediterraneum]